MPVALKFKKILGIDLSVIDTTLPLIRDWRSSEFNNNLKSIWILYDG